MRSLSPSSGDALLDDPSYGRLKDHLLESTGLAYYADKDQDFARKVWRRLAYTGSADCAAYLDLLFDSQRGATERDALIAEIAIGETYFFRHQEHFDALRDRVIPDLLQRNRLTRSLRIWCAGCADGPEPYSLAILLKREMAAQLAGWDVTILGTDINQHGLARARTGQYVEWALRGLPEDLKNSCFSQEEKLWSLRPEYKKGVSFQYYNLVEHPFPSLVHNLSAFDLIVCRNVMIYFRPEVMERLVQQFHQCLVPGAWLLVGPSEPNMTFFKSFRTVNFPGAILYQRPSEPRLEPTADFIATPFPELVRLPAFTALAQPIASRERSPMPAPVLKETVDATLAKARSHADRGAWEEAAQCCEELLVTHNLNSRVHFYQGLVLEQMRKHTQAEQSLRRAIYLDRDCVLGHYYLGLVLQSRPDAREAARCFENALRLLENLAPIHSFADADGITAGELKRMAATHLEILRERICNTPV